MQFFGAWLDPTSLDVHIVMEHMDAGCLDSVVTRMGRVPEPTLAWIAHLVLSGLRYLQSEAHVVHRDIKPSNVLVNTKGEVKLCDFGTSCILAATIKKTLKMKTFVGTVGCGGRWGPLC